MMMMKLFFCLLSCKTFRFFSFLFFELFRCFFFNEKSIRCSPNLFISDAEVVVFFDEIIFFVGLR